LGKAVGRERRKFVQFGLFSSRRRSRLGMTRGGEGGEGEGGDGFFKPS
jgi:hypothetical protein